MLKKINILVLGDSLVYGIGDSKKGGWVNRLRLLLEKRKDYYYDIYNLGIPDDNSRDILKRFRKEIIDRYYQGRLIVIYQFGANDSSQAKTKYYIFKQRLKTIFQKTKLYTTDILFLNIPKAIEMNTEGRLGTIAEIRNEKIKKYNNYAKQICEEENVKYIEIDKLLSFLDLSKDGIHPNNKGHKKIANIIYKIITKKGTKIMSEEGGVWRTVGGRRIFIKDGEDLSTAMKNSGKFNGNGNGNNNGNRNNNYHGSNNEDDFDKEDKLNNLKGEFWTRFEDLENDVKKQGAVVEDIDDENMTISYTDDDDNDIEADYEINTIYKNDNPSTISIIRRKSIKKI